MSGLIETLKLTIRALVSPDVLEDGERDTYTIKGQLTMQIPDEVLQQLTLNKDHDYMSGKVTRKEVRAPQFGIAPFIWYDENEKPMLVHNMTSQMIADLFQLIWCNIGAPIPFGIYRHAKLPRGKPYYVKALRAMSKELAERRDVPELVNTSMREALKLLSSKSFTDSLRLNVESGRRK